SWPASCAGCGWRRRRAWPPSWSTPAAAPRPCGLSWARRAGGWGGGAAWRATGGRPPRPRAGGGGAPQGGFPSGWGAAGARAAAAGVGAAGLAIVAEVFAAWHSFRGGGLGRRGLQDRLGPLARALREVLRLGQRCADSKVAQFCANVQALGPALWTFAAQEGV